MECPVCCQIYTGVKRSKVMCAYCHYDACQECYRTYITTSTQDAHCMSCRRAWTRDVLMENFPPYWINGEYKRHREKVLDEREKQLLPESQYLVANYREAARLRQVVDQKTAALVETRRQVRQLEHEIWRHRWRIDRLSFNGYRGHAEDDADPEASRQRRRTFTAPCPVEDCRGYIVPEDPGLVCRTCGAQACPNCGVQITDDDGHQCDEDVALNFRAIKRDTRPCPACAVPTMKSSGCNQMWCTRCQATWDWASGAIQTGVIHNPHYFQYLRQMSVDGEIPRQPGDARYTLWEFLSGFDQHLRPFYVPKKPLGWVFERWADRLRARGVDLFLGEAALRVSKTRVTLQTQELRACRVVLCMPPTHAAALLGVRSAFAKRTAYEPYWSVSFFGATVPASQRSTPWGVIAVQYPFGVVSAAATLFDVRSPATGRTLRQSDDDEAAREIRRQLGLGDDVRFAYLQSPYHDQAYVAVPNAGALTRMRGIDVVGCHNGRSSYHFTSMESAVQNALTYLGRRPRSPWHLSDFIRCVIFVTLASLTFCNASSLCSNTCSRTF